MNGLAARVGAACGRALQRLIGGYGHTALAAPQGHPDRWRCTSLVGPGWYLCRITCALPKSKLGAAAWLSDPCDPAVSRAHRLPLRDGKPAMRLLHIAKPSAFELRLGVDGARILRFGLWRTPRLFGRYLVQRRLLLRHPAYARLTQRALWGQSFDTLWRDYNQLFDDPNGMRLRYVDWLTLRATALRSGVFTPQPAPEGPLLSVLMPVYDPPLAHLRAAIESVQAQSYSRWQLCIADDASRNPEVRRLLLACAMQDPRIRLVLREHNGHICAASNSALALAEGEFVVLLDHDDLLAPHALQAVATALQRVPNAAVLYSDEDKIDAAGERFEPHFKPAWNPDLLLSQNYASHLGIYRTTLVRELGGFRPGFEGSQDHDLLLRCSASVGIGKIVHIPDVLYHWRAGEHSTAASEQAKRYAADAGLRALRAHLAQHHPGAQAEPATAPHTYRVRWPLPDPAPLVSILMPTRDQLAVTRTAVQSVLEHSTYPHYELLILDNQSHEPETLAWFEQIAAADPRVRVLHWDHPFNYSAINNFGARCARGSVLALLNNDIEVISPGWLDEMVSQALRPEIGCVGAKLYYGNGTLQHAGVILGLGGVAGHSHKHFPGDAPGYFRALELVRNVSAVTAACLVVRREIYERVGGLDEESLTVAFNDVDFCLKVRSAGWRNLWTPHAELYHHESISRGADDSPDKRARFESEKRVMRARWGAQLADDPYYSPHLTRAAEDHSMAPPRPGPCLPRTDCPPLPR